MRRWGADSYGAAAAVLIAGSMLAMLLALPFGWLGPASAAGPLLGAALFAGWRCGEDNDAG